MVAHHVSRIRQFLDEDLWKIRLKSLPKRKAFWYRQLRIWMIATTEFVKDKCSEKASALTYFSLLSIVPVMAMAFAIAQAFGLKKLIDNELKNYFKDQEVVYEKVSEFANNMLSSSGSGVVAAISAVFLIYAVVRLLNNIEIAFNDIWNTPKGRSIKRMVTDYLSIIFLGPIILILSSAVTVYISTELQTITESVKLLGFFQPVITLFIRLIPYTLIWFLLFLIYVIFPNTTVKLRPALLAGILAGTAYQITQIAWVEGQVYMGKYGVIYSSFAALPLFMIWLQLSWTIILFGAEFAYAVQKVDNWVYEKEKLKLNQNLRRNIALMILVRIIKYFENNDKGIDFEELCDELKVPRSFVRSAVDELTLASLLVEVPLEEDKTLYLPGLDVHKINLNLFYQKLDSIGDANLPGLNENEDFVIVSKVVGEWKNMMNQSKENRKLLEL